MSDERGVIRAEIFRLLFGIITEELHMSEIERRSEYALGTMHGRLGQGCTFDNNAFQNQESLGDKILWKKI